MKRAVLAYSGGLDTSVTIRWLREQDYDVIAVAVDVGQQEDFDQIRDRGQKAGAAAFASWTPSSATRTSS